MIVDTEGIGANTDLKLRAQMLAQGARKLLKGVP